MNTREAVIWTVIFVAVMMLLYYVTFFAFHGQWPEFVLAQEFGEAT